MVQRWWVQNHCRKQLYVQYSPTFGFYLAGLVFGWLKNQGGLAAMEIVNRRKADKLYGYIGSSNFYSNPVESAS